MGWLLLVTVFFYTVATIGMNAQVKEAEKRAWIYTLSELEIKTFISSMHCRIFLNKQDVFEALEIVKKQIKGE